MNVWGCGAKRANRTRKRQTSSWRSCRAGAASCRAKATAGEIGTLPLWLRELVRLCRSVPRLLDRQRSAATGTPRLVAMRRQGLDAHRSLRLGLEGVGASLFPPRLRRSPAGAAENGQGRGPRRGGCQGLPDLFCRTLQPLLLRPPQGVEGRAQQAILRLLSDFPRAGCGAEVPRGGDREERPPAGPPDGPGDGSSAAGRPSRESDGGSRAGLLAVGT